jgi:hypothetical protein
MNFRDVNEKIIISKTTNIHQKGKRKYRAGIMV